MNAGTASITRGSPYYVRVSLAVPQYSVALAKWTYDNNIRKVYTIVADFATGLDMESYFIKTFKALGGEIVGSQHTPLQETNFAVYLEKALQAKPDAVFMMQPIGSPSIAFVKTYVERGLKDAGIKLLATGETQELLLPNFTDDVIGTVTAFHYTETNTNPQNILLRNTLVKLFGGKAVPDIGSVGAWDGATLIHQAVAELGPNADGIKYVDFMKGKKLDSPRGPMMIDPEERDVIHNIYIRRVEKRDGKLTNVDIGQVDMVKDPWKIDNPLKSNER